MERFKDAFPTWAEFKQFLIDYSFYYDKTLYTDERVLMYYTILYRNFANSHTAFDNEVFYEMLSLTIAENFREFFIVRKLLDEVANAKLKDLLLMVESVQNVAENPNMKTDPDTILDYIGTQSRSKTTGNLIDRVHSIIPKIHIPEVKNECKKYEHLFLRIIPKTFWLYEEENDEE